MNIRQMMGRLVGELKPSGSKALELKTGQVVRGEVLQKLENRDALLKIQGTVVRARLDAELQPGQTALLQVRPNGPNGEIVLQTATTGKLHNHSEAIQTLLKALNLQPDHPEHQQIVRMMQEVGIRITRQQALEIAQTLSHKPSGISIKSWIESALILIERSLPVTPTSIQALHSAVNGPPIGETIGKLDQLLNAFLQQSPNRSSAQPQLISLLQSLQQMIGQWRSLTNSESIMSNVQIQSGISSNPVPAQAAGRGGPGSQSALMQQHSPAVSLHASAAESAPSAEAKVIHAATQRESSMPIAVNRANLLQQHILQQPALEQQMKTSFTPLSGNPSANERPQQYVPQVSNENRSVEVPAAFVNRTVHDEQNAAHVRMDNQRTVAASHIGSDEAEANRLHLAQAQGSNLTSSVLAAEPKPSFVLQLLKLFGLDHEANIKRFVRQEFHQNVPNNNHNALQTALQNRVQAHEFQHSQSMKSIVLQLQAMDELPPALKETAQQLSQQITGQQLLLSQDRSANFSHVALLIPLFNEHKEQTAAISIQSRKSAKGELEADNCRLLFDLDMQTLGPLLIDAAVADKRVMLTIYNDFPGIDVWMESGKSQLSDVLQKLGMELASIRTKDYPSKEAAADTEIVESHQNSYHDSIIRSGPYKGVDLRI